MSRSITIKAEIKSLSILKKVCGILGYKFVENQKQYIDYYSSKPCSHAIKIPSARHELGLVQDETTKHKTYNIRGDFDYNGGLPQTVGSNAWKLMQKYEEEQTKYAAMLNNHICETQILEDRTRLTIYVD